jgi:uncharacterized protein YutE (UPF0331/DUF86 family)
MARDKVGELQERLAAQGYDVLVEPSAQQLPQFLQHFEPDLVATSEHGNVVVEIAHAATVDTVYLHDLAAAVAQQGGWRLEVVLVNQPVAAEIPAQESLVGERDVDRFLASAEQLSRDGEIEAAAMLAWSAAEAILRRSARSAAPELERQGSARVLKHLYGLGLIEPATFEKLVSLMNFRNAVAHGFAPRIQAPPIDEVVPAIRQLQSAA